MRSLWRKRKIIPIILLIHQVWDIFSFAHWDATRKNIFRNWRISELSARLENEPRAIFSLRGHKRFTPYQLNNTLYITHLLGFSHLEGVHRYFNKSRFYESIYQSPVAIFISMRSPERRHNQCSCSPNTYI